MRKISRVCIIYILYKLHLLRKKCFPLIAKRLIQKDFPTLQTAFVGITRKSSLQRFK